MSKTRAQITRRQVLKSISIAGAGLYLGLDGARAANGQTAPNDKLRLAVIGIGGRGRANLDALAKEAIVALCDVDDERAGDAYKKFPDARKFYDFRELFDALESKIDAVVISTPDHTHYHPALCALRAGKHVYLEKPMAHTVAEARTLTDLAAEKKVATQLGVQRHALENVHRVVELVQAGAIGEVRECHAWVDGDRGMPLVPGEAPPVPPHLKWDLWIGPARERAYHSTYAPYGWRFWWDFGTGETGNWGCHILDIPFWALELSHPTRVDASGPPVHAETTPRSMQVRFEFPTRGARPPLVLHWYHVKEGPPILKEHGIRHPSSGVLFVGKEGLLLSDFAKRWLLPEEKFKDFQAPPRSIPDSPGFYREWLAACRGGPPATCHFGYSGPMAETVLLGNAAYRIGKGFPWDAKRLKAGGAPEAEGLIRKEYRKGWEA
jgi:predicted dehydrogenase